MTVLFCLYIAILGKSLVHAHARVVHSFVLRGGGRPLAVFRRAFSLPPVLRPMRPAGEA